MNMNMHIEIRDFTQSDIDAIKADGLNGTLIAEGRRIVTATDSDENTAELYVDIETIDRLGHDYLQNNISLTYSTFFEKWFAKLSQNAYYNDIERYPEKVIDVEYVDNKYDDGAEIYKNKETGRLYMRQVSNREAFAKWLTCHSNHRYQYIDDCELRANIVFRNGTETEKITYEDWNGSAAYSNTFNPNFNSGEK